MVCPFTGRESIDDLAEPESCPACHGSGIIEVCEACQFFGDEEEYAI
jgi:RecJ-like exonuclease